jgi:hypothetical protein
MSSFSENTRWSHVILCFEDCVSFDVGKSSPFRRRFRWRSCGHTRRLCCGPDRSGPWLKISSHNLHRRDNYRGRKKRSIDNHIRDYEEKNPFQNDFSHLRATYLGKPNARIFPGKIDEAQRDRYWASLGKITCSPSNARGLARIYL